jgi:translation initiation factor 3 subunit M
MPAVSQLEKDEKYQLVYELLKIFLTKKLDSYLEFQSANSDLLKDYGIFSARSVSMIYPLAIQTSRSS